MANIREMENEIQIYKDKPLTKEQREDWLKLKDYIDDGTYEVEVGNYNEVYPTE